MLFASFVDQNEVPLWKVVMSGTGKLMLSYTHFPGLKSFFQRFIDEKPSTSSALANSGRKLVGCKDSSV
jgi:hypothetical protein